MADKPLSGATVVVTRPAHQAEPLCRAVESAGGKVIRFPAVEILAPRAPGLARSRLGKLRPGDWIVFVSANAVLEGLDYLPDGRIPRGVNVAAVGPATARVLRERASVSPLLPLKRHDSEGLLECPELADLSGRRVVIVKAPRGRRLLGRELRRRGATVENALVYRRARPSVPAGSLGRQLPRRGIVMTTVTSGELLDNLIRVVDAEALTRLQRSPLVAAGERVAGLARWAGFRDVATARGADPESLVRAAAERLASNRT